MRTATAIMLLAISPALLRETNSHAAAKRGTQQYSTNRFAEAVKSFATAAKLAPSSRASFNLGTSQIAAGQRTEGSATLAEAMKDPSLRASSLFNRGNSALASNAYDHAIRDYTDALRLQPNDTATKRNLEIALQKQAQQQKQQQQQQKQSQGPKSQQTPPQPAPGKQDNQKQSADQDADALLRSVQQQEQEELARMKKARVDPRAVGW